MPYPCWSKGFRVILFLIFVLEGGALFNNSCVKKQPPKNKFKINLFGYKLIKSARLPTSYFNINC